MHQGVSCGAGGFCLVPSQLPREAAQVCGGPVTLSGVSGSPEPRWTSTQVPEARVSGTFRSLFLIVFVLVCVLGGHITA